MIDLIFAENRDRKSFKCFAAAKMLLKSCKFRKHCIEIYNSVRIVFKIFFDFLDKGKLNNTQVKLSLTS